MEKLIPRLKLIELADLKEKAKNSLEHLGKKNMWYIKRFKNYIRLLTTPYDIKME